MLNPRTESAFLEYRVIAENAKWNGEFSRNVSLRVFAENEKFHFFSKYATYCRKHTVLLLVFANND